MKLLLTSAGIKNPSIHEALEELLGKPIAECDALCVPTASYAMAGGPAAAWRIICGKASTPLAELGWKSLGVLELTALPTVEKEMWVSAVRETDALLVGGGDPVYLCRWMRQSGLADLLPSLPRELVYVGVSAGSMIAAPLFGEPYEGAVAPAAIETGLGLLPFSLLAHLDHERFPENSLAELEKLAASISVPTYLIDDQTALKVIDGEVEVVSEGNWKLFIP